VPDLSTYNPAMANSRLRHVLNWVPAALAVLMIAMESTATMSSENTSRWLLPLWVHLFGPISHARWEIIHHYIRKTGHFVGYGMVSLCFFHGWRTTLKAASGIRSLWLRSSIFAVGCTILVASADEYHQTFLPSRTGTVFDVGLDTCGAIAAQLLILFLMPLFNRPSSKSFLASFAAETE
jgi:VanZ family protein